MTIITEIEKPTQEPFRRAFIKRRSDTTGLYETDWQDITTYIIKWSKIKNSVDELKLNDFKQSGISLKVRNDEGKFNPENNLNSLWYGFMTRYRTLLKIEAGLEDSNGNELPTNTSQGIFILTDDISISGVNNLATLNFKSLRTIFDEVKAKDIPGLGVTQTASDIVTKFKDATDGSGSYIFRQFITSTNWIIQTTTTNYNLGTTTSLDGLSCWQLMKKISETEGFIVMINRSGGLEFRNRDERTTTSQFTFYGQGFKNPNVIQLQAFKEPISKFFNFFRFKFQKDDTTTSYVTAGTVTSVNPSVSSWKYGTRTYEFENQFFADTASAQAIADNLLSTHGTVREEIKIKTLFTPQLEISDKVLFNYHSYDEGEDFIKWDLFNWASDAADLPEDPEWPDNKGENFDWTDVEFKILSKETNLEKFTNIFILRKL